MTAATVILYLATFMAVAVLAAVVIVRHHDGARLEEQMSSTGIWLPRAPARLPARVPDASSRRAA